MITYLIIYNKLSKINDIQLKDKVSTLCYTDVVDNLHDPLYKLKEIRYNIIEILKDNFDEKII